VVDEPFLSVCFKYKDGDESGQGEKVPHCKAQDVSGSAIAWQNKSVAVNVRVIAVRDLAMMCERMLAHDEFVEARKCRVGAAAEMSRHGGGGRNR
jgi:hypothetical protein